MTIATAKKIENPSIHPHFHPSESMPNISETKPAAIIRRISSSLKFLKIFFKLILLFTKLCLVFLHTNYYYRRMPFFLHFMLDH